MQAGSNPGLPNCDGIRHNRRAPSSADSGRRRVTT
jgi:hypothetical protein